MRTTHAASGVVKRAGCGDFAGLQALEPRTLLAYLADSLNEAFNVPTELFQLVPPSGAVVEGFGRASVALGDLDGDGRDDFAVSAPGGDAVNGVVFVYSGATRSLITTLQGASPGFGFSLLNVGDLTGDDKAELAVGSPQEATVRIYSAASGNLQKTFTGDSGSEFGYALAYQANAGADQDAGLVVGAPTHGAGGAVYAFNLVSGEQRFRADGSVAQARLGHAVGVAFDSWASDVYGQDGFDEIVAGAPGVADAGRMSLFDGEGGGELDSLAHVPGFGSAIIYAPTSFGTTLFVGAPGQAAGTQGRLFSVFIAQWEAMPSLQTSSSPVATATEASFGSVIVDLGDLDGRPGSEFAVEAPASGGSTPAFYVMGVTSNGNLVFQDGPGFAGATGFGAIGDVDADGFPDVLRAGPDAQGQHAATAYSSLAYFELQRPNVISRGGTFIVFSGPDVGSYGPSTPVLSARTYAVRDDQIFAIDSLPGVGDDFEITAVNDDGDIAGYVVEPPEFSWQSPIRIAPAVIIDGVRHNLEDRIANIQGPTDINVLNMVFKRVGPTGELLIEEATSYPGTPRAWILTSTGSLIFLWNGYVEDQAADGTVLGTERADQTVGGETRLWTREGGKVAIERFYNALRMNDDHEILGTDHNGDLAVFRDGSVTRIAGAADIVPGVDFGTWTSFGIDAQGRGVARLEWYDYGPVAYHNGYFTYVVGQDNQLTRLDSLIARGTPPTGLWEDTRQAPRVYSPAQITLADSGDIFVNNSVLTEIDASEGLVADARGVRSVSAGPSGMRAVAVNPDGIPISFHLVGGEWQGRSLSGLAGTLSPDGDLAVFVDPKDGFTYAVTLGRVLDGVNEGNGTVTLYREQSDGTFADPVTLNDTSFASSAITTRLTVFVSADNRVHIAGLNQSGQLILFYQTGQRVEGDNSRWQWFFENVELTHLAPNGESTPNWVDELTVYVAPWNGLNIAGLTASGDAEVVWWAPGREFWSTDNLSQITGLTRLVGGLTSYVTPWGGLNVAGIDTSGDLQVVWWVPGFETQWRSNNMTVQFNGPKLDPVTVSSYVTPWGGLNIAGMDATSGEAIVYWWAPGLTDWTAEALTFDKDPQDPLPTGRLIAQNNGQQLNLFGRADSGEVIRLYWNPGDAGVWGLQNLTRISV